MSAYLLMSLNPILGVVILGTVYTIILTVHRLYFNPLCHIPGPKLAAATWWYEFYFQVVKGGQYFKEIAKLHKQYGPIVRITPSEVHIDDPEFYDTVYSNSERRDKAPWHKNSLTAKDSAFATQTHDLHRTRRGTLNPFFSKSQIRKFAPYIQERADILCRRFKEEYKGTDNVLVINEAFACLTSDAVMQYSFAENYNFSEAPDFYAPLNRIMDLYFRTIHVVTNFPYILNLQMSILPRKFVKWLDPSSAIIFAWMDDLERQIDSLLKDNKHGHESANHATIFTEILQSKRPAQEKSKDRLFSEAQVIVSAGVETTAWAMSVGIFYILNSPEVLRKLKTELEEAWKDPSVPLDLSALEALPYLSAVIMEALRLAYGGAARNSRSSPDKEIAYTNPTNNKTYLIPRNTPISMTSVILHHNETVFPHSHTFAPERWLSSPPSHLRAPILADKPRDTPLSRYMVSFSKGSRNCLGMPLAYAELYITLACVVRRNEFVLWETGIEDVAVDREFLLARPREGSKGVRVKVV